MNNTSGRFALPAVGAFAVLVMLTACATHPIPQARLSKAAFITAGDTNIWLIATGKSVSVADVDVDDRPRIASACQHCIHKESGESAVSVSVGMDESEDEVAEDGSDGGGLLLDKEIEEALH